MVATVLFCPGMDALERCDAEEIRAVLTAAAQPRSRLLLDRPMEARTAGAVRFTTAALWRVSLWRSDAAWVQTMEAQAPDGRRWVHGCQRDWVGDGAVIDPLLLLSDGTRLQLWQRLQAAGSWPEPEWDEGNTLPDFEAIARRRRHQEGKH